MKQVKDFKIIRTLQYSDMYSHLSLTPADDEPLPQILPGQFVQVAPDTNGVLLRRPISINDVNVKENSFDLLVRNAGKGTEAIISRHPGDYLNVLLPLGNGFTYVGLEKEANVLLIGGGVGVAPLLYLGRCLKESGITPRFLLGARSAKDILELDGFSLVGEVYISTEDGSMGEKGLVTTNSVLNADITKIYCCGPAPMMKAVAAIARERKIDCEVSLENMMACGLGACLCCVENTVKGNVCVCTEGPVFNINMLNW